MTAAPNRHGVLVVGLDLSLNHTGIAHATGGRIITDTIPGTNTGIVRLRQLATHIRALCAHADLVVIEGPSYGTRTPGFHERAGLHWMVLERLHILDRPVAIVPPATLKKYATGKGSHPGLGKGPMIDAASRRYPTVDHGGDPDQVDALWLAAMGVDHLTGEHTVPATHRSALDAVTWPTALAGAR